MTTTNFYFNSAVENLIEKQCAASLNFYMIMAGILLSPRREKYPPGTRIANCPAGIMFDSTSESTPDKWASSSKMLVESSSLIVSEKLSGPSSCPLPILMPATKKGAMFAASFDPRTMNAVAFKATKERLKNTWIALQSAFNEMQTIRARFHPGFDIADARSGPMAYTDAIRKCITKFFPIPMTVEKLSREANAHLREVKEMAANGVAGLAETAAMVSISKYFDYWIDRLGLDDSPSVPWSCLNPATLRDYLKGIGKYLNAKTSLRVRPEPYPRNLYFNEVAPATRYNNASQKNVAATVREPKPIEIDAYRIWFSTGGKQAQIAQELSKNYHRSVRQDEVSRYLKNVRNWIEAGNVLPGFESAKRKIASVDPAVIDMGQNCRKTTKRQRGRLDEDAA